MNPRATLRIGHAHRDVTPPRGAQMSGFAIRTEPALGTHDALAVRATIFDDGTTRAALVVFDWIGVDAATVQAVRTRVGARTDLAPERVFVAATHTHGGPAVLPGAFLGVPDPTYLRTAVRRAADAVEAACRDLAPAELSAATGRVDDVAFNRRDPAHGPVDPTVTVLATERAHALAHLTASFACHPVTLGPANRLFTRDYPGACLDTLEARFPGANASWLTGCAGQINTGHDAAASLRPGPDPRRTFGEADRIGRAIATAAADAIERSPIPASGPVRTARAIVRAPYARRRTDPRDEARAWRAERQAIARSDASPDRAARAALLDAWIAWADAAPSTVPQAERLEVACVAVGPLVLALYPGETFVEYALDLRDRDEGALVVPVGYANDAPGYLPHPTAFATGGYEVDEAFRVYGRPSPFTAEAAEAVHATMVRLTHEIVA